MFSDAERIVIDGERMFTVQWEFIASSCNLIGMKFTNWHQIR